MPTVKIPPVLRARTGGEAEVAASGDTVGEVLEALAERHPDTREQLFAADGELNRYVNVYLNDEDVRVLDGLETAVTDSDTVVILPAMAGGCPSRVRAARAQSAQPPTRRDHLLAPGELHQPRSQAAGPRRAGPRGCERRRLVLPRVVADPVELGRCDRCRGACAAPPSPGSTARGPDPG